MKSQKFYISDILNRDSQNKCNEKNMMTVLTKTKESALLPSLTPPMTTEEDTRMKFTEKSKIAEQQRKSQEPTTLKKRSKDPIGQILDNLCRTSVDKKNAVPSAFSPILTGSFTNQLSSLSLLAQYDRRNIQTSPSVFGSPYVAPLLDFRSTLARHQMSTDDQQYLHSQKLAQQLHFQQLATNTGGYSLIQPLLQEWQQGYFQRTYGHPAKFMAFEKCNSEIASNRCCVYNNMLLTQSSPFWMTCFQESEEESLTVKQSRISQPPRYQCEACHKSYSTFGGLCKHKQFHCVSHVKKEFKCKCCEKSYGSLGALKMHIRTHTLPCKCKLCGKAFSRPWLLQGHLRTHNGEKPFKCAHCSRAFADRSNLRAHLQTHTDIKKYGCKNCSKTFSRMSLLLKHGEGSCLGLRR